MFVGHALVAFALVAVLARSRDWSPERALSLGVVAGAFAALPDVDMAYALLGVASIGIADAMTLARAFWATGEVVHRAVTHSLVLGVPTALVVGFWVAGRRFGSDGSTQSTLRARGFAAAALGVAGGIVVVAGVVSGPLGAAVTVLFCGLTLLVSEQVARQTDHSAATVTLAAAVGLLSHPFGDLFTGTPPAMLYPLEATLVAERVALHPDATVHLLAAFGLELTTVWLALVVWAGLRGVSLRDAVSPWAGVGTGYAVVVFVLPPPTLSLSYHFVFSVLAVGTVGLAPLVARRGTPFTRVRRERSPSTSGLGLDAGESLLGVAVPSDEDQDGHRSTLVGVVVTGLSAVTLAWVAYGAAYLLAL